MIDVFEEVKGPVLAIERVPRESVSSYGIIDAEEIRPGVYRIRDMVEKPPKAEAPSDLAIIGRYILTPDIFPAPGAGGAPGRSRPAARSRTSRCRRRAG
jgi:UTP--glucose-1-phosphate uridylyltransferase